MKVYFEPNTIEVGLDEAGRGCLFGPVFTAGVVWDGSFHPDIRDSKKLSLKKRVSMKQYILDTCLAYSVQPMSNEHIDTHNILKSTIQGWHRCIREIETHLPIDTLLVDGPNFDMFLGSDGEYVPHVCLNDGDNQYLSIAAASILAKTFRDEYIQQIVDEHPSLEKYDLQNNKGYGTVKHREAIKAYGLTPWHRHSFKMK